ncbi:hypothetical protein TeGR_g12473 [Tetraparma gracilis]|uniref:Uncharacterized protein n=1 Tax=Tetraparma gracilis TaxID=2962635 RepID=A0ABQ6MU60_9STRA|nr:hypothetical protein TeGR_g12473 [Tetraparma gracilis]
MSSFFPALLSAFLLVSPLLCTGEVLPTSFEADYESLTSAHDDVFHPDVLPLLTQEIRDFFALGDIFSTGEMKFGKKSTVWLPLSPSRGKGKPRNFIEYAVEQLYELAVPEQFYGRNYNIKHYNELIRYTKEDIKGGEWWIQARGGKEGIGFHYDKDESYASNHMKMRFPIVSTITYLTDSGAPTLILNQTSLDGSIEYPEVPHEGFLSYPKTNRHVTFRGDLNHGVASTLSLSSSSEERVTLLVNWWVSSPMAPNCQTIPDGLATKIGFNYPEKVDKILTANPEADRRKTPVSTYTAPVSAPGAQPFLNMSSPEIKDSSYTRHMEKFPPADSFFYDMPLLKTLEQGTMYALEWGYNHVFANVGMLDLFNSNQISSLFRFQEPKCLIFVKQEADLKDIQWWLQPLAKNYQGKVKVYTAVKATAQNAWPEFGVVESDLPIAVMHDTNTDRKMVDKYMHLNKKSLEMMWKKFLAGGRTEF